MLPPKEVNMTTKNQFGMAMNWIAAIVLAITFIAVPSMAYAKSAPLAEDAGSSVTADALERAANKKKAWSLPEKCNDKPAKILFKAGFTKPGMLRGMWAITYRESKHQNLDESSRWYSGALGWAQIQTSAWSGKSWWSRSVMLDRYQQAVIVKKYFFDEGLMHNWGYGYSHKNDSWYVDAGMYYSLWGSGLTYSWVIAPFNTGWSLFPKKCTPEKV
jgi:hypothetical protein